MTGRKISRQVATKLDLVEEEVFDAIAITVNGPKAWDLDLAFDVTLTDLARSFHITLSRGVLIYVERDPSPGSRLHLMLDKARLIRLAGGDIDSDGVDATGELEILKQLFGVLDPGDPDFEIVVP